MRIWFLLSIVAAAAAVTAADAPTEEWSAVIYDIGLSTCRDTFVHCVVVGSGVVFDADTLWSSMQACHQQFRSSLELATKKYNNGGYPSAGGAQYAAEEWSPGMYDYPLEETVRSPSPRSRSSSPFMTPLSNTNDVFAAVTTDFVLVDARRPSSLSSDGINRTEAEAMMNRQLLDIALAVQEAACNDTEKLASDIAQIGIDQQQLGRLLADNRRLLHEHRHMSAEAEVIIEHAHAESRAGWWTRTADLLDHIFDTVERQRALGDMPLYNLGSWFSDRAGDVLDYVFGPCSLYRLDTMIADHRSWMRLPTGPVHSIITRSSPFVDTTGGIYTAVGWVILLVAVVLADWSWLLVRYAMGSDLEDAENETKADKLMQQHKLPSSRVRIRHITSIVTCIAVLAACRWMMSLPTASATASIEHTIQTTVTTTSLPSAETASNSADMQTLIRMRQANLEADVKKRFDAAKARVGSCSTVQCIAKDMEDMCRVTAGDAADGTLFISDLSVWSMTYNQWMALRHKLALLRVVWGPVPEIRQRLDRLSILEDAMSLHVSRFASVNGIDPDRAWRMHRPICDTMNATYTALATLVQPGSVVRPKDVAVTDVHFLIAQLDQGYVQMMMGLSRDEHLFWSNHINLVLAAWMPKTKPSSSTAPAK